MTKEDLIEKISDAGGEYKDRGIIFTSPKENRVEIKRGKFECTVYDHSKDLNDIAFGFLGFSMAELTEFYDFVADLSEVLGIYAPKPREVTKDNTDFAIAVDDKDLEPNDNAPTREHALGMVEAYEKILIGRDITVAK